MCARHNLVLKQACGSNSCVTGVCWYDRTLDTTRRHRDVTVVCVPRQQRVGPTASGSPRAGGRANDPPCAAASRDGAVGGPAFAQEWRLDDTRGDAAKRGGWQLRVLRLYADPRGMDTSGVLPAVCKPHGGSLRRSPLVCVAASRLRRGARIASVSGVCPQTHTRHATTASTLLSPGHPAARRAHRACTRAAGCSACTGRASSSSSPS